MADGVRAGIRAELVLVAEARLFYAALIFLLWLVAAVEVVLQMLPVAVAGGQADNQDLEQQLDYRAGAELKMLAVRLEAQQLLYQ
jgi:hypothetical protein